jgi:hypothetical protein
MLEISTASLLEVIAAPECLIALIRLALHCSLSTITHTLIEEKLHGMFGVKVSDDFAIYGTLVSSLR